MKYEHKILHTSYFILFWAHGSQLCCLATACYRASLTLGASHAACGRPFRPLAHLSWFVLVFEYQEYGQEGVVLYKYLFLSMARDRYHNNVRAALEAEGWLITDDPLRLQSGAVAVEIDLGAEKLIGAEKDGQFIAVEIKTFGSLSPVHDFGSAYGQFMLYRRILRHEEPNRVLYLAIPKEVHETFFQRPLIKDVILDEAIRLIIYDHSKNSIVQWIN
jgi:hypothetical protein